MTTVKHLRLQCKIQNLSGYSKMLKYDLIKYLKNNKNKKNKKIVNDIFKIGIHVFKNNNISESIINTSRICNINAVQIFTHGPRNMLPVLYNKEKIIDACNDISLYVHSSYPTNPWNGKKYIFEHTIEQFRTSYEIGSKGVVLHIPKMEPLEISKTVKKLVNKLIKHGLLKKQKVILEMKAVKQHETQSYESPEKINRLIDYLIAEGLTHSNVGICIDTAHIYAGNAEIYTYKQGIKYVNSLKYPEWICLIHLNGNVYDIKKRSGDKHAIPFDNEDKIWKGIQYADSGCKAFIEFAKKIKIDFILEIKEHHTLEQVNNFINFVNNR
jgi:endonuclease IV